MHRNGGLYILKRRVIIFDLVIALRQQNISTRIGFLAQIKPQDQCINPLLPLLLNKIQLRNRKPSVDLHRQGDVGLRNHQPVIA